MKTVQHTQHSTHKPQTTIRTHTKAHHKDAELKSLKITTHIPLPANRKQNFKQVSIPKQKTSYLFIHITHQNRTPKTGWPTQERQTKLLLNFPKDTALKHSDLSHKRKYSQAMKSSLKGNTNVLETIYTNCKTKIRKYDTICVIVINDNVFCFPMINRLDLLRSFLRCHQSLQALPCVYQPLR